MELVRWLFFIAIVSQVVKIIEKDCDKEDYAKEDCDNSIRL